MSECNAETLSEVVDRAMIRFGISKKKHFASYLILAEECWESIFQNTLWVIKSVWKPTFAGNPYNYIQMPLDCQRLLSVGVDDRCGLIQPLFYNTQLNVVAKPTTKACGCNCDCGGLCEAVNSMVTTTKLMFTISGVPYYQRCWLKYCNNGDILKYCETPVVKYNNTLGTPGDYSPADYNNDYLIGTPGFSDYTIETITSQEKICHLETAADSPCGCPVQTEANERMFYDCCGYWVGWGCSDKRKKCNQFSPNINNNHYGEIKVSDCGTKIYYRPNHNWRKVTDKEIPDYLLVNYQTTGTSVGAETLIPKYARNLLYAELDNGRKEYNSTYSEYEKMTAHYKVVDERAKITGYLNPISLHELSQVQDEKILW